MPRILRNLKILEVSGVDRGAGEGVKIMLMKRLDEKTKRKPVGTEKDDEKAGNDDLATRATDYPLDRKTNEDVEKAFAALSRSIGSILKSSGDKRKLLMKSLEDFSDHLSKESTMITVDEKTFNELIAKAMAKALPALLEKLSSGAGKDAGDPPGKAGLDAGSSRKTPLVSGADDDTDADTVLDADPKKPHEGKGNQPGNTGNASQHNFAGGKAKKGEAMDKRDDDLDSLPTSVRKRLEQADSDSKILKQLQLERDVTMFGKRAKSVGLAEADGELMRKAYGGDAAAQEALDKRITEVTKARDAALRTGGVFKEVGSGQDRGGLDAYGQLEMRARELKKREPKLTAAQAFTKVVEDPDNAELVKQEKDERMARIQNLPSAA